VTGPASVTAVEADFVPQTRLHCFNLHSAVLPEPSSRRISVYLPEAYETEPERRFPVFYLQDGQNLMDPATAYIPGRTWRAGEAADRTAREGLAEPVILVGVANTGVRRMAEYTPRRDRQLGGGEGDVYGRLLVEELKPFLDMTFRTLPAGESTGLGGSSLGGLISLYLGLRYPQVFTRLGVLSPSIWWNQRSILNFVSMADPKPELRIWLDIGTGEGQRHVHDTELLHRLLLRKGWQDEVDLRCTLVPDAVHNEDAWAARFGEVLSFLFPATG
jgi:predicted alpha/beta superfamily hydrolase